LKEIKKGAFIRREEKANWQIRFIVIFSAIKIVLLPLVTLLAIGVLWFREKRKYAKRKYAKLFDSVLPK